MLVQIFITKEEENALDISEHNTIDWRRQYNIPDGDEIELVGQTRKRFDIVSTAHSDSHDQKRNRLEDTRVDIITRVHVTEYANFIIFL